MTLTDSQQIAAFSTKNQSIDNLKARLPFLIATIRDNSKISDSFPAKFDISDGKLTLNCYGHKLEAKERIVHGGGNFHLELNFHGVAPDGKDVVVSSFYFNEKGNISAAPGGDAFTADHDKEVSKYLRLRLYSEVLESPLFAPISSVNEGSGFFA